MMSDGARVVGTGKIRNRWGGRRAVWGGCLAGVAVLLAAGAMAAVHWPFRYKNVEPLLEHVFAGKVTMNSYRMTFFPHPGLVADGLTLRRNSAPDLPPVGSAKTLVIEGRWGDLLLLRRRVAVVDVDGFHVVIPAIGTRENREDFPPGSSVDFAGPTTAVSEFRIRDSLLDLMRANGSRFSFPIHQILIGNLEAGKAISYAINMESAVPVGHIEASGSFGPLHPKELGATAVSGRFMFSPVQLGSIHGLGGTMHAHGNFGGVLMAIQAEAETDTPDFEVGKGRPTGVGAKVQGTVNALNGDVHLGAVEVRTGATTVHAVGDVGGRPKSSRFEIAVDQGRAEDLLRPFMRKQPPVTGAVWLRSRATLAPGAPGMDFLKRLRMEGRFEIPAERLTDRSTEAKLSAFSGRAQGEKADEENAEPEVLSSLHGLVTVLDGVALARPVRFDVPGASVNLNGTFSFRSGEAKLAGNMRMQSDISHVTTGWKSWMLKPLGPLFRRPPAGAVVPIAVVGGRGGYRVKLDMLHRTQHEVKDGAPGTR